MGIRTDLAMEAKALWEKSAGKTTKLAGVRARERERDGFAVTDVHILDRRGEAALGKPAGRYVTLELPPLARDVRPAAEALAAELRLCCACSRGRVCSWPDSETKPSRRMPSGRCACAGCS